MKSLEELKTYVGLMMLDLRGNWAFNYVERMEYCRDYLEQIASISEEDRDSALEDIELINSEIEDGCFDGRIFRDSANFYGYSSEEGLTNEVLSELKCDMSYPEYNLPGCN